MTVFNRKEKTLACLDALLRTHKSDNSQIDYEVFITDDGSSDGTREDLESLEYPFKINILQGTGDLFWNAGMNVAWRAAIAAGGFDGYLWLNNDTTALDGFWKDLKFTDDYCRTTFGKGGIYVGSTRDSKTREFTYGGFNFVSKWTLRDEFVLPSGNKPLKCQCGHGNITFVSAEIADEMGTLYDGYFHGGGDHDYTYRAFKSGFPVLVLPHYAGECNNDHVDDGYSEMPIKQRLKLAKSSYGNVRRNTLIFQRRCFPYRYPFVYISGYLKALFPKFYFKTYRAARK